MTRVRRRTLGHMNALLATAMVACSSKGESSSGYGVVDMMPEPARCSVDASPHVKGTATGVELPDGTWEVTVKFTVDTKDYELKSLRWFGSSGGDGPKSATFTAEPGGGTVKAIVQRSSGSALLDLAVGCGTGAGAVRAEVIWKVDHLKDSPYPVAIRAL